MAAAGQSLFIAPQSPRGAKCRENPVPKEGLEPRENEVFADECNELDFEIEQPPDDNPAIDGERIDSGSKSDDVVAALTSALTAASAAGQWDIVRALTEELTRWRGVRTSG
jgi:hypothetical protein